MKNRKKGFTLVELLLVIAVIALLATVTVGGALKATKSARVRRVDAMCTSLKMALENYNAQEGRWPLGITPNTTNDEPNKGIGDDPYDQYIATFTGDYNWKVFDPLIPTTESKRGLYISPSEFFVKVNGGKTKSLRQAIEDGATTHISLGYPDPNNTSIFRYFKIKFNTKTDSVRVMKEHED